MWIAAAIASLCLALCAPLSAQRPAGRTFVWWEAVRGDEEVELRWPVAVAASSNEQVAVADVFGPQLLLLRKVGVSWQVERSVGLPAAPGGLAWDGARFVASLRQGGGLVALEGQGLTERRIPLPRGVVPGAIAAHTNGDLLVYDAAGRQVLRISGDGEITAEMPVAGGITALATSPTGGFFAAIAAEGRVLRYAANGELEASWELPADGEVPAWPVGLAAGPDGNLVVVDRHAGRLLELDATGRLVGIGARRGWEPGLLLHPAGIARLPDGVVVVADEGNGRAQFFRRAGQGSGR